MDQFARFARTDPSRIAAGRGDSPVHRHRKLEDSHWASKPQPRDESFVETERFAFEHAGRYRDFRALEDGDSASADAWIRIDASDHGALDLPRHRPALTRGRRPESTATFN